MSFPFNEPDFLISLPLLGFTLGDAALGLLKWLLFLSSAWLILLILIQRGKGGGLSAALGGGGGDSAFGAKAGDAFTKITIFSALAWIGLCMITIARFNPPEKDTNRFAQDDPYADVEEEETSSTSSSPSIGVPSTGGVNSETTGDAAGGASSESEGSGLEPAGDSLAPAGGLEPAGDSLAPAGEGQEASGLEPAGTMEPATEPSLEIADPEIGDTLEPAAEPELLPTENDK